MASSSLLAGCLCIAAILSPAKTERIDCENREDAGVCGSCDVFGDVDISLLQTDFQVIPLQAKEDGQRPPEHDVPQYERAPEPAREKRFNALGQQRHRHHPQITLRSHPAVVHSPGEQPPTFFQTDSVAHSSDHEEPTARSPLDEIVASWQWDPALLPAAFMAVTSIACALWFSKKLCKRRVAPCDAGGKSLLADAVAKASPATLMNVEEETRPEQWDARVFSTPVRDAFGLTVSTVTI